MRTRLFRIPGPELFGIYAGACSTEMNTWDRLTTQQQRGWAKVSEHIASLAAALNGLVAEGPEYPRHD